MHNFKELKVWQESMKLAKEIYLLTSAFPSDEKYGITSQLRRAAISVPSNVAEGTSRTSSKELIRFLEISLGSAFELETQLLLSLDLNFITPTQSEELNSRISVIQKMLFGFKQKISKDLES